MNGDWQQSQHEHKREARRAAQRGKAASAGRDGTLFLAFPMEIARSPGWRNASHTARSLLIAMATAPTPSGGMPLNGHLRASKRLLGELGWRSAGVICNALRELIACNLLHQTRYSRFPNKAALYAMTWARLGPTDGLDADLVKAFKRGAYMTPTKEAEPVQRARTAKGLKSASAARKAKSTGRGRRYSATPS